jgi:serine/threonine protein kinase
MSTLFSRQESLFADALVLPPAQRGTFLAQACGDDLDLLAHLVALVAAHEGPESLIPPGVFPRAIEIPEEKPGDWIGRYKLLQKIGEGGCGMVWMAEQEEPVRRRVALKVIKLGMDTRSVIARFEAERQALAMMDHPNIAKVHDAGSTETGRPFFVMELVRGIPITKYCDENHLTPKERLELFIKVCQAIQHAHQKSVIHRDIKPSNILVTVNDGAPMPKVIDFGIAKATQGKLTDATVFTAFEQFIGTPVYMSPEQAEMSSLDIDTRSDIYSLGVLLYELLTGRPPFDPKAFAQAAVDQIRQQIREREPQTPSHRLHSLADAERTTIAKLRSTAPAQLSLMLRGDLDWVVMRCLEKDRTRRYDTANGLATDIQRYLRNEPVVARPPSTPYLLQKLFRRHRVAFAAAVVVSMAIIIGAVVSTWQAIRATRAEREQIRLRSDAEVARGLAQRARGEAEKLVGGFLLEEFYADLAPTIRLKTIAKLAEQAVAYYDRLPPALVTLETERNRATALMRQSRALQGEPVPRWAPLIERAIADFERLRSQGDLGEETTRGLALALLLRGGAKWDTWESGGADKDRAVALLRPFATSPGSSPRSRLEFANVLSWWSAEQPRERGLAGYREARQILTDLGALDLSDLDAASAYGDLTDGEAWRTLMIGRIDDAERLTQESQALAEQILVKRPGDLRAMAVRAWSYNKLGVIEARRFHLKSALDYAGKYVRATDDWVTLDPADGHGWQARLESRQQTAQALLAHGRVSEAEKQLRFAIALGGEAPRGAAARRGVPFCWLELAAIAARRGDRDAAEQALAGASRAQKTLSEENKTGPFGRLFVQEFVEHSRRLVRLSFHESAEADRTAKEALVRIGALAKRSEVAVTWKEDIDDLRRAAWIDSAKATLKLGRLAEAENAARTAATGPQGNGYLANLETNRAFAQSLLALAIARQGRGEEARTALAPALTVYRNLQKRNAEAMEFNRDFAFCLHVQATTCRDDPTERIQAAAALAEAAQLLDKLSDEAKALRDVRELMQSMNVERAKLERNP